MSAGFWWVVLVAIASSVIAVYFYIRHIRVMFFTEPEPGETAAVTEPSVLTVGTVAICLAATLVLGVVPGPVLDLVVECGRLHQVSPESSAACPALPSWPCRSPTTPSPPGSASG